jgi:phosphatidylserine decarboxylase
MKLTENRVLTPWKANTYEYMAVSILGNLPSAVQRGISKIYASVFNMRLSKHIIKPYCRVTYSKTDYLNNFSPPNGKDKYDNFQDFFTREFKTPLKAQSKFVWPCEGYLCHAGNVKDITQTNVKGDVKTPETIFGVEKGVIPINYYFTNIFLHNKNYHRIHAPIDGDITRIQKVDGDLVILRPWIYKNNPSIPAFRNERINIDILDRSGKTWFLSIIGGPAVGTIKLPSALTVGSQIKATEELALFLLGSTCCIAAPIAPIDIKLNRLVEVGAQYA